MSLLVATSVVMLALAAIAVSTTSHASFFRLMTVIAALIWFVAFMIRPSCVPIPQADVVSMDPPISERNDRFWGVKTFQCKDEKWYQCKPWISRFFFQ